MHEVAAAYIASASGGSGTLHYQRVLYPFSVGGAGIGGIGVSTIRGKGDVYNLTNVAQFPEHMTKAAKGSHSTTEVVPIGWTVWRLG
jgi:hypothetical protein